MYVQIGTCVGTMVCMFVCSLVDTCDFITNMISLKNDFGVTPFSIIVLTLIWGRFYKSVSAEIY
jgi:hypothetical protein